MLIFKKDMHGFCCPRPPEGRMYVYSCLRLLYYCLVADTYGHTGFCNTQPAKTLALAPQQASSCSCIKVAEAHAITLGVQHGETFLGADGFPAGGNSLPKSDERVEATVWWVHSSFPAQVPESDRSFIWTHAEM